MEKCRKKKQKNFPEDQNVYWPIFFYGTHETLWIHESDLRPFEENRSSLGNASNKKKFKEAMIEAFTNPLKQFQFQDNEHDKIDRWLSGIDGDEAETAWVAIGIVIFEHKSIVNSTFKLKILTTKITPK